MKTFQALITTTCKVYMSIIKSIIHQRKSNFDLVVKSPFRPTPRFRPFSRREKRNRKFRNRSAVEEIVGYKCTNFGVARSKNGRENRCGRVAS